MRIMQCWDDGDVDDIRLVDILRKHGAKATFNINPGGWKSKRREAHRFKGEYQVYRLTLDEMPQVYEGFWGHTFELMGDESRWQALDTLIGRL